ncbi:MAG: MFS transporter [Acidimicrobiaceae bacterium]|nr:MFS transporter [Acidimicrobiaceae bacterium]
MTEPLTGGLSRRAGRRVTGRAAWLPAALALSGTAWGSTQITPLLVVYQRTLGLSTGTIEAVFVVSVLGLIPGLLVAGAMSDARGRRVVAVPAAGLSFLASAALIGGAHELWLLFIGRFLAGISSGAAFGAGTAWVRELSRPPHGDAGDHVAARRSAVAMTFGYALGPLVAGFLAQWAPRPLMVAYLPHLVLMVTVLLTIWASPETVTPDRRVATVTRRVVRPLHNGTFKRVVAPMAPWVFAAPAIAFALLPSVVGAQHATDGTALVAAVTATCALAGVFVQPLARRLDSEVRPGGAAPAGLVVLVAGLVLAAVTTESGNVWLLFPCAVVFGGAYGLCMVAGLVQVQRLAPPGGLARFTVVYYALAYVGFAAPYALALGAHVADYPTLLSLTAVLALVTAAAIGWAPREIREPGPTATAPPGESRPAASPDL